MRRPRSASKSSKSFVSIVFDWNHARSSTWLSWKFAMENFELTQATELCNCVRCDIFLWVDNAREQKKLAQWSAPGGFIDVNQHLNKHEHLTKRCHSVSNGTRNPRFGFGWWDGQRNERRRRASHKIDEHISRQCGYNFITSHSVVMVFCGAGLDHFLGNEKL